MTDQSIRNSLSKPVLTNLELNDSKIYQKDIDFFTKINKLKKKHFSKEQKKKIKLWYSNNSTDLEYIFNNFLNIIYENEIAFNKDLNKIYKDFIVFAYRNSNISI